MAFSYVAPTTKLGENQAGRQAKYGQPGKLAERNKREREENNEDKNKDKHGRSGIGSLGLILRLV